MTNTSYDMLQENVDVRHLYYFAVVAEECSLRRASERLFMAQPPLSRQIKLLEERLGVTLFVRHSKGLTLTEEGSKVLEIIQPLLVMRQTIFQKLRESVLPQGRTLRIGFTTAFDQGTFVALQAQLGVQYGSRLQVRRTNSPKLVADVRKGRLDAALVALPLESFGVMMRELPYAEPLIAVVPAVWPEAKAIDRAEQVALHQFTGKPLFWFKRERNPAFFDITRGWFAQTGFVPYCLEEPDEHDVLLARIASGEGMGLFASSFSSITRDGVVFFRLAPRDAFLLRLGVITLPQNMAVAEDIAGIFVPSQGMQ